MSGAHQGAQKGGSSQSTIGLKLIVAATGLILLLFVIGHMLGNLQVFLGADAFNAYGEKLRTYPALLWAVRAVIALAAFIHVVVTIRLALLNKAARPIAYAKKRSLRASLPSRTMVFSGLMLLAFVVYHLSHYTWKITNPEFQTLMDGRGRPDIYAMVIAGFKNGLVSVAYIAAMVLLGFHLSHGIASMFQTAGWTTTRTLPRFERAATLIAVLLVAGYIAIPIAVLLGLLH